MLPKIRKFNVNTLAAVHFHLFKRVHATLSVGLSVGLSVSRSLKARSMRLMAIGLV